MKYPAHGCESRLVTNSSCPHPSAGMLCIANILQRKKTFFGANFVTRKKENSVVGKTKRCKDMKWMVLAMVKAFR